MTDNYGILAYPAKHSLSPAMFNAAFKAAGIDAQYGVFEIPENEFEDFMDNATTEGIAGFSVSLPYKERVMAHLNFVNEDAQAIGAVNTVKNEGGVLAGHNTDYLGLVKALREEDVELEEKKVVVLGAGGASRAAVHGLKLAGAEVWIWNRHAEKAQALAEEFEVNFLEELKGGGDVLVQTTSIWTLDSQAGCEDLCAPEFVEGFGAVMDIVYKPFITPLLKVAQEKGKKIITGEKMLLYQAVKQFEIWTGKEAPVEVMREALVML